MLVRARPLLGTIVEIRAAGRDAESGSRAVTAAFEAIAQVHQLMSFHEPESDVSRMNRFAHRETVKVDPRTWEVLTCALQLSRQSKGLFDCTIASRLMQLGYLPAVPGLYANDDVTYADLELLDDYRVHFLRPLTIDLGGIAKGYAVDRAIKQLQMHGIEAACVNAGGDLRVIGDRDWPVGIRLPDDPRRAFSAIKIRDEAVATTANYFSTRIKNGVTISPLIDRRTGMCRVEDQSVSVIAHSCMLADALTKIVWLSDNHEHPLLSRYGARAIMYSAANGATAHAA
ncbi:MAG TPA: FAD:protein FMN transferase [Gammaproteobacteria bacterium]|nr:FAD:protein FMN transferase [Gammaproteobacteria bacterium]